MIKEAAPGRGETQVSLSRMPGQMAAAFFREGRSRVARHGLWRFLQLIEHGWVSLKNRRFQPRTRERRRAIASDDPVAAINDRPYRGRLVQ
jgi:hypothetical protein